MADEMYTAGEYEVNPYFQLISDTQRSSSTGRSERREKPRVSRSHSSLSTTGSTHYQEILGRDEGSYCWFRPERADDVDVEEPRTAAFIQKTRTWIQKYVSDTSFSLSTNPTVSPPVEMRCAILPAVKEEPLEVSRERTERFESRAITSLDLPERNSDEELPKGIKKSGLEVTKAEGHKYAKGKKDKDSGPYSGRRALVKATLENFQRLWENMESDADALGQAKRRRWDMRVAAKMREEKMSLEDDIIGEVEGLEVGDSFTWRAELAVIGLHKELVAGINVLKRPDSEGGPIATSIVFGVSNFYSDNEYKGEKEPSIYSGEGGLPSSSKDSRGYRDQTLTGGNLALKRSAELNIPIRVIRGVKKGTRDDDKKYVYDGLYEILSYKFDEGVHGNKVYKFVLNRLPAQRPPP